MSTVSSSATPAAAPWWKFGHVWLVLAGPLVVIVAGFITLWLAMSRPDPVVAEDYYQRGIDINKTLEHPEKSLAPAMKAQSRCDPARSAAPVIVKSLWFTEFRNDPIQHRKETARCGHSA